MVLYVGDSKSWEGQFSNHLEEIMAFTLHTLKAVTALLVICKISGLFFYGIQKQRVLFLFDYASQKHRYSK